MPSQTPGRELCAAGARRVGEPIFATASRVDLWLVLEVPGVWREEVGDSLVPETLPGSVLLPVLKAVPRSRALFIKGAARGPRERIAFYVAVTDEAAARLYHFELESYADLEGIDLFGLLAEDGRYDACREIQPVYLVCTHGTHDRCCAKFGFPVYCRLAERHPGRVWQSSHVGGDRFAANVVCLPHGLYYGHVEQDEVAEILDGADRGELYPARLRGRTCYPPPVQAAEHFLRRAGGEACIAAYRLWSQRQAGEVTEAAFLEPAADELHTLQVEPEPLEGLRGLTCGTPEAKPVTGWRLLDHRSAPFTPETRNAGETGYTLRPAAMRDYGFIYRLRRDSLRHCLDALAMAPEQRGPFLARFDVMRHRMVSLGDVSVGAVSVLEREDALHLANLHLLPAYQGRGLGTALVREVQRRAEASGRRVTAQVLKVNPARAFYERLGFRVQGEQGLRYRLVWAP